MSDELASPDAERDGSLGADTVSVSASGDTVARGGRAQVVFSVILPEDQAGKTVQIDVSGSCTVISVPQETARIHGEQQDFPVVLRVPQGAQQCTVTFDAELVGKPDTGDGRTVDIRSLP